MKNNIIVLRSILCLSILLVVLTIKLPAVHVDIGTMLIPGYKGLYSLAAFLVFFGIFSALSKKVEDIVLNRMKFLLSISFILSLVTNIIFS